MGVGDLVLGMFEHISVHIGLHLESLHTYLEIDHPLVSPYQCV